MDFVLFRGRDFSEPFNFKNAAGKLITMPNGEYKLILERGLWAKEYKVNSGLTRGRTQITWRIPAEESKDFAYSTMYYTLYLNDDELARGVLRIQ